MEMGSRGSEGDICLRGDSEHVQRDSEEISNLENYHLSSPEATLLLVGVFIFNLFLCISTLAVLAASECFIHISYCVAFI